MGEGVNREIFSKRDTNIVKGIAVLAMVFHHTYPNNPGLPINYAEQGAFYLLLAEAGKVCVSLLTILSGYGLTKSWNNEMSSIKSKKSRLIGGFIFSIEHYIQLLSMYWCVLLFCYMSRFITGNTIMSIYGSGNKAVTAMILDILGIGYILKSTTFVGGWYLSSIILLYFLFPLLWLIVKKASYVALIILYLPWVYYICKQDYGMHTDWWLFYAFSFAFGIFLAESNCLSDIAKRLKNRQVIVIVMLISLIFIRGYIALPFDNAVAFAIIIFEIIVINRQKAGFLNEIGIHSAHIWLLHTFIGTFTKEDVINNHFLRFIFRVIVCSAISMFINRVKEGTNYNSMVKKFRKTVVDCLHSGL
ncbi:MAG: acyltransferase [Lachnospiraceae bacterium]|nr:acyltransferase [Lachnospiraceae bacterium]